MLLSVLFLFIFHFVFIRRDLTHAEFLHDAHRCPIGAVGRRKDARKAEIRLHVG